MRDSSSGHIVIGVEMVDEAVRSIPEFPVRLANELKHCIIAHHGELEYGSPKKPALAEALALNLADNAGRQDADSDRDIQRKDRDRMAWVQ